MNYNKLVIIPMCLLIGLMVSVLLAYTIVGVGPIGDYIAIRHLEAQAKADNATANMYEARANKSRADGEAAIFYAAAFSVRKDAVLVAWYAVRRDLLMLLALLPLEVGGGIAAGVYLARRKRVWDGSEWYEVIDEQ